MKTFQQFLLTERKGFVTPQHPVVKEYQAKQHKILRKIYALDRNDKTNRNNLNKQYEHTIKQLQKLLGPDAHVGHIDPDLHSFYSDTYKDRHGIRPRGHTTWADADAFIKKHTKPVVEETTPTKKKKSTEVKIQQPVNSPDNVSARMVADGDNVNQA
jgi:hypothetical protein